MAARLTKAEIARAERIGTKMEGSVEHNIIIYAPKLTLTESSLEEKGYIQIGRDAKLELYLINATPKAEQYLVRSTGFKIRKRPR